MTCYACLFEAKSIQGYILRSGRLRHIVGASELLDSLTPKVFDDVLGALELQPDKEVRVSRCAGGAVYLFAGRKDHRDAFRDLWSAVVRQYAPGLEFVVALGEGDNDYAAFGAAKNELQGARNRQSPLLPAGAPVALYAPRTGEPAVWEDPKLGPQDAATKRFGQERFWRRGGLTGKFAVEEDADKEAWPRNLEFGAADGNAAAFPFLPDNRYLGLLHADGNGLGQLLQDLTAHAAEQPAIFTNLFSRFSEAVSQATVDAARRATTAVLLPARGESGMVPARPIVLGGDDLTILLRADLALPFTVAFLRAFEETSAAALEGVRKDYPEVKLPPALTAGGGIAFIKSNHPFHLAHGLAESLAAHAKERGKAVKGKGGRIPPTLAFHKISQSSHGDYASILADETACDGALRTTLEVYGVDAETADGLPAVDDLLALAGLLGGAQSSRSPLRQLLTLLGSDSDEARRRYRRWREVMAQRDGAGLEGLDRLLGRLCGELADDLPVTRRGDPPATPLGDVATLLAVSHGAGGSPPASQQGGHGEEEQ